MVAKRRTLTGRVTVTAEGVRSGRQITVEMEPAPEGMGVRIARTDVGASWPVNLSTTFALGGCTAVGTPKAHVAYVEHLIAACAARGLTDLRVSVDGPEIPLLDGSVRPWIRALDACGGRETTKNRSGGLLSTMRSPKSL